MTKKGQVVDIYPLSPVQEGMLFHSLYQPGSGVYIDQLSSRIRTSVEWDPAIFRQTFEKVAERHPILRSAMIWEIEDRPHQVVVNAVHIPFQELDWRDLPAADQEARLKDFLAEERRRGFDLSKPPLLRLALIRLAEKTYQFILMYHHVILDAWSVQIVLREAFFLLETLQAGTLATLEAPRPYRDYIQWLEAQDREASERFWRRELEGFTTPTPFRVDQRGADGEPSWRYGERAAELPAAVTQRLLSFGRTHRLTANTLLQGAWALLLARYSGDADVVFGATVSGRPPDLAGIESMVGLFINTLAIRNRVPEKAALVPWLEELQTRLSRMRQFEHTPLVDVQRWSEVPPGRALFESILVFESAPADASLRQQSRRGFEIDQVGYTPRTNYPLTLMAAVGHGLHLRFLFQAERLDGVVVERLRNHYLNLLVAMIADAGHRLGEIDLLAPAERRQLVGEWNDSRRPEPDAPFVHRLFRQQVEIDPEAPAVVAADGELSRRELDLRSDQLAGVLRAWGVRPESRVVLALKRSSEMMVALLAVLKAGGAYIPLDPTFPARRLALMLTEGRPDVVLSEQRWLPTLPASDARRILIDADGPDGGPQVGPAPEPLAPAPLEPGNLAYLIFTSGSTGRPKGVQISHRALLNFLLAMQEIYHLGPGDTFAAVTSLSFDIASLELFLPLITGARVLLIGAEVARDGEALAAELDRHGANLLQATPTTWRLLTQAGWSPPDGFRMLCGGEALPQDVACLARREAPLWNLYGPTETTIWSSVEKIVTGDGRITVGRPIANTDLRVVDRHSRPVPARVPGELLIGGSGLARGYFRQPGQTAERFVPDALTEEAGARLYRTGDLARYLDDGRLEFLGRMDHQVKIRGFRVELGDVESVLARHPAVDGAVVQAVGSPDGDQRLVAYLVEKARAAGSWRESRLESWEQVWDGVYREAPEVDDPTLNLAGWKSDVSGLPIPREEMQEWIETTVDRLRSRRIDRVLEIGCGTGLLLLRLAPHCSRYWGLDFSRAALDYVASQLAGRAAGEVRLLHRAAHEVRDLEARDFDTVILNSVVQYFPDLEYLLETLAGAVERVAPGGGIFVGDVRSLPLLEAFHGWRLLHQAAPEMSLDQFRRRQAAAVAQEQELTLAPELFRALPQRLPQITRVEVELRRGRSHNELTGFRYDVFLQVGGDAPADAPADDVELDWQGDTLTLARLGEHLRSAQNDRILVRAVPNARLAAPLGILGDLARDDAGETVGDLRRRLEQTGRESVDPEAMWALAAETSRTAHVTWSAAGGPGCFDVLFHRGDSRIAQRTAMPLGEPPTLRTYVNHPVRTAGADRTRELRAFLEQELPPYMVPTHFVFLEAFPLTPNRKVDRRALPSPEDTPRAAQRCRVAPRTAMEAALSRIWADVLRVESVGVDDDFFELGGHSLFATQVIHRVREALDVELSMHLFFNAPTIAELAAVLARQKLEAVEGKSTTVQLGQIEPDPAGRFQPFPLNEVQEAYWVGRSGAMALGNVSTHIYFELEQTALDLERFERVVNRLIDRHDMLRAVVLGDGRQQVLESVPRYEIGMLDLRGRTPEEVSAALLEVRERMSHQILPAERWPLFEILAGRLDGDRVRLHVSTDALVLDAWSLMLLLRELRQGYLEDGPPAPPPELSFRDYVLAEARMRESELYRRSWEYWEKRLETLPPAPELPLRRAPDTLDRPRFVRRRARLGAALWQNLKRRASQAGLSPSGLVAAAFAEVLAVWSKSPRLTLNLTLFNRLPLHPQINEVVGDFTSLTLLAVEPRLDAPFEVRARALQERLWEDLDHRYVNGVRVIRELARRQGGPRGAVMPVVLTSTLSLTSADPGESAERGKSERTVYDISQTPQVWLDHQVFEGSSGLSFSWDAVEDLFPAGLLDEMFGAYCRFLEALATREETWRSSAFAWLPEEQLAERRHTNATDGPLAAGLLHGPFVEQTRRSPEGVAVVAADRRLTYGELDRASLVLGARLRDLGARPGGLVAVVMEKGWEQVVAVLSVLRAGAAYLPVDAGLPEERRFFLMEHGEVEIALTQPGLAQRLAWPESVRVVSVEPVLWEDATEVEELTALQGDEDLAYVIFTSGSTGLPKGVMIDHRGALNTVTDVNERFGMGPSDRVLALSSLSFDLSVYDVFGILGAGGTLVLPEPSASRDPARWLELLVSEGVTVWNTVPALLEMLVEYVSGAEGGSALATLRRVLLSGDWIPLTLPDRIRELAPAAEVVSLGGATEASIWSIFHRVERVEPTWASIPYGRPLRNQSFHVLNAALEPRPVWVPGELYIGGVGLARGYWRDDEQTAARFFEHPRTGERLYRTGDLGRYLPGGEIEFLGREDFQVKIQGHRIELGEIEAVLAGHPALAAAVVTVVGERMSRRLAAYVVPRESAPDEDALVLYLRDKLPGYMVPGAFRVLDSLPLTANGKVDRKALPAIDVGAEDEPGHVAPRDDLERSLARIWSEILHREPIGVLDSFFALGGDSVQGIRFVSKAQEAGLRLTPRQLFERQTIAALAVLLRQAPEAPIPDSAAGASPSRIDVDPDTLARLRHAEQPVEDVYPLTPVQQGLLFHALNDEASVYFRQVRLPLRSALDVAVFERAWQRLIERHAILRTDFAWEGFPEPLQVVRRRAELPLEVEDWRAVPGPRQAAKLAALCRADRERGLRLERAPLMRLGLIRLADDHWEVVWSFHHIILDAWSAPLLFQELFTCYRALSEGLEAELEAPRPYRDYVDWLYRQDLGRAEAFWRRHLAGLRTPTPLGGRRTARGEQARPEDFLEERMELSRAATETLQAWARRHKSTLNTIVQGAWALLLGRTSGERDVLFGAVSSGRSAPVEGIETMIGMFVNTLPVRVVLPPDARLVPWLRELQEEQAEARHYEYSPLVDVQGWSEVSRGERLFESIFSFLSQPPGGWGTTAQENTADLAPGGIGSAERTTYPFTVMVTPGPCLAVDLVYDRRRFEISEIRRRLAHLQILLGSFPTAATACLQDLPMLTPAERQQVLREWNDTRRRDALPAELLQELFERQVERRPEAVAVVDGDRVLSYSELDRRANRLAHLLREQGARRGEMVAIHLERGAEMLWGVLGILKAECGYVPLETTYPAARMEWIMAALGIRRVVTRRSRLTTLGPLAARLPALGHVVCLDSERAAVPGVTLSAWEDLVGQPAQAPPRRLGREDIAYIIFTSGSTGTPKGVVVQHGPALNLVDWVNRTWGVGADDRVLFVTALSFDLSVYDIFGLLAAGGSVRVASSSEAGDPERLARILVEEPITFWDSAPAALQQLVPFFPPPAPSGSTGRPLRRVFLSGDWVPLTLPARVAASFPGTRVIALGGATEATVWSNFHQVREIAADWVSVPYGRPITDARYHVLERNLRPCPIDVPGDLYIAGRCLASAYAKAPGLTARSFLPDPFAATSGERLYRTGDRARFWADGTLEFLGRRDNQVKVRGFRIELGEIETVLAEHPGIAEAVAVVREDAGERRVVAYWVAGVEPPPAPSALRAFLAEYLPEYMLPAHFVRLDELPVTANGKVDRGRLPEPDMAVARDLHVAPRTVIESGLAAIWTELLPVKRVGVEDNFFELGGHSLIATRLMMKVREEYQVDLPIRALFDTPTVGELAMAILKAKAQAPAVAPPRELLPVVAADPARRFEPFPLNDVQQAYWIGRTDAFELGGVASHLYTEMEIRDLDLERFHQALTRLIERHEMLRAVILPDGRQQILESVPAYEVETVDLRGLDPETAEERALAVRRELSHQTRPADRWPLFEVRATRLDSGRVRLHLSLDALIHDAWSLLILYRDLVLFYEDPARELPALDISFRDYVMAEAAFEGTELYRRSWEYWQRRIAELPSAPELPLSRDPASLTAPRFVRRSHVLPTEIWERLKQRGARTGLTPSGLIASAFAEVLGVWSKSPRLTLNLTLFNRLPLHPRIGDIVGDFTSLSLLGVDPPPDAPFELRARAVQERLWEDLDHRYVSGVRVVRELARSRGSRRAVMPVVLTSTLSLEQVGGGGGGAGGDSLGGEMGYTISQTPQVWLDHQVFEGSGGLVLSWDAVEDLFPAGLLDDLFDAYRRFLESLAMREETWVERGFAWLPPTQTAERCRANATAAPLASCLLHDPFVEQARRSPQRLAVVSGGIRLSYGELERASRALGRRLRELGAQPNRLVAVAMEKGWEQVVAALAVVRSGAAYLPVDADLPVQRRDHLLERGEVELVLTQPWLAERLQWPDAVRVLTVDEALVRGDREPPDLPSVQEDRDLAYVIFTSGSTGEPKGVMIDHRGALNTILDVNERFAIEPADRVLGVSSLSFDLSVWDVFGALARGAALVLPEPSVRRNPARWLELLTVEGVTVWNSVPALMEMLVEYASGLEGVDLSGLERLRRVFLSGDWIPLTLPDRIRALASPAAVISLGGATEASIWSIYHPVKTVDPAWSSIPYGRPLANQTFQVLNASLEPCPVWVPGELFIGGVGLARGYWRDEAKTLAQFFDHPATGERLYRTGDLGRYLPGGEIEFLGREDFQVKVGGYRVELGEIEAALVQHPELSAAVVAAVGSRTDRRLTAWVVPRLAADSDVSLGGGRWIEPPPTPEDPLAPPAGIHDDPLAALEFKIREPGLRRYRGEARVFQLEGPESDAALRARFLERRTDREFHAAPIDLAAMGELLAVLAQVDAEGFALPKYRYPSAGNLYPVQVYLCVKPGRVTGLAAGTYYYDPRTHQLVLLHAGGEIGREAYAPFNQPIFEQAAFSLFLAAQLRAVQPLYGDLARDFSLLEAGYVGQLLMSESRRLGIGLCPIGQVDREPLRGLLDLEESHEVIHSLLGGRIAAEPPAPSPAAEDVELPAVRWPSGGELPAMPDPGAGGVLVDELERLRFKLAEPGIRRFADRRRPLALSRPALDPPLVRHFVARRSFREFLDDIVPLGRFASFLDSLRQLRLDDLPLPKYRYPSAGNLYPVQAYVRVEPHRVEGLPAGLYYYHPRDGRLVQISTAPIDAEIHHPENRAFVEASAFTVFLIADLRAIESVYAELARDFCFLEAGYMSQLLMTTAPDLGLGLCPVGRLRFEAVRELFDLETSHLLVHSLVGGPVAGVGVAAGVSAAPRRAAPADTVLTETLQRYLGERLPAYMVPGSFVRMDALPLTPNGKVDRKALPGVGEQRADAARSVASTAEPQTPTQEILVGIWAEVLGLEAVGMHENFFDLGGHSVRAVQANSRMRQIFRIELPLRELFEQPTIGEIALKVDAALRAKEGLERPPLEPIDRPVPLPASFAQQRLWFLGQLDPGSPAYNIPVALRLEGDFDPAALAGSLRALARRHETLRTTFAEADAGPVQVIAAEPTVDLGLVDLGGVAAALREDQVRQLVMLEGRRPFDLARGPLLRTFLLRLAAREHVLFLNIHHVIADAWSIGNLVQELVTFYGSIVEGRPVHLPELAVQYADYAVWQRRWLRAAVLEHQLDFWREQLAGLPPLLELPTDRPRPHLQSYAGALYSFRLGEGLSSQLAGLGRRQGVTLFMVMMGAFQVLLARLSGQPDVALGVPVAGRDQIETEKLIGFFVNTLVLRTRLEGNPTFGQILEQIRDVSLKAYSHQDLPFETLVEELRPARSLSHTPLFQVLFVFQNVPIQPQTPLELRLRPLDIDSTATKHDLVLTLHEGRQMRGTVNYSTALFDATTIQRWMDHFAALLESAVADPSWRLTELELLSPAQRTQLLGEWNFVPGPAPTALGLHQLFERQAERFPDHVALVARGGQLSYGALERRANRLAHHLIRRGVAPEVPVALLLDRSQAMPVAVLAVLKAGGFYVPLDPGNPPHHSAGILERSGCKLLLVESRTSVELPGHGVPEPLFLRDCEARARLDAEPETPPSTTFQPDQLAYLVHTSGSTGRPKGVATCHRSVVHHLRLEIDRWSLGGEDVVLQRPALTFDASVRDLLGPLAAGARVVLLDGTSVKDPETFLAAIETERVSSLLSLVPTFLSELLRVAGPRQTIRTRLRRIVATGEPLRWSDCRRAREIFGDRLQILNEYGPTECTLTSTFQPVDATAPGAGIVPLGRPNPGERVHVLDRSLVPVPVGVVAEIYIGGAGLARGYHGAPALTAKAFLPDPVGPEPGRLYRTGDRARRRPDGRLEFLGRTDHQVKLRGLRVELGEIEVVLGASPAVRQAVVVLDVSSPEVGPRLVAYLTPQAGEIDVEALRAHLRERLPEHFVPARFVQLENLPKTPGGKVDRASLPRPDGPPAGAGVAPRTPDELRLVRIWEEVLDVRPIGVTESFFDLGGHSLLAVRLMAAIRREMGRDLPLTALFGGATIRHLARKLGAETVVQPASPLVGIQPHGEGKPFFCVHPAGGNVLSYVDLAYHMGETRPFYGLKARGVDDGQEPIDSIVEMARCYVETVRDCEPHGPYLLGGWSFGGLVALEMAHQLRRQGADVALLALLDTVYVPGRWQLDETELLARVIAAELDLSVDELRRQGSFDDQLAHVVRLYQEKGVLPEGIELRQIREYFAIRWAHWNAARRYEPDVFPGQIDLFWAAQRRPSEPDDPVACWGPLTGGELRIHEVPGYHETIVLRPHVEELARRLEETCRQVEERAHLTANRVAGV